MARFLIRPDQDAVIEMIDRSLAQRAKVSVHSHRDGYSWRCDDLGLALAAVDLENWRDLIPPDTINKISISKTSAL